MKKIILASLLALSFNAFATSILPNTNNNSADAVAIAGAASNASAASNAAAQNNTDVKVGQITSVGVGQATQVDATTGNQAVNISSTAPDKVTYRYAPDIAMGSLHPTSPCMGSSNVGGSGVGFSFGVGTSWTDDECGIRETARSFMGMDLMQDAIAIMCSSKYAAAAPICNK